MFRTQRIAPTVLAGYVLLAAAMVAWDGGRPDRAYLGLCAAWPLHAYARTNAWMLARLADALGRRPVLAASAVLFVAFDVLLLTAGSLSAFVVAGLVGGAGRALSSGPLEAW